jgi:hypothetical protein
MEDILTPFRVPLALFLQGYLSELQSKRLTYDAERRQLVQRATDAMAAAHQPTGGTLDPALAQLTEEAATINSECFQSNMGLECGVGGGDEGYNGALTSIALAIASCRLWHSRQRRQQLSTVSATSRSTPSCSG